MHVQATSFAVVICHGSYHTPEPFEPFLAALKAQGIEGYCPQLPTSDLPKLNVGDTSNPDYDREPPVGGYPQAVDDMLVIIDLLRRLIEGDGKNVLLIGHSSGGGSATAAAVPGLQAKSRQSRKLAGGIVGIFYECGFMLPVGESVNSFFQPKDGSPAILPPYCQLHAHGFTGLLSTTNGSQHFFNGLPPGTAEHYASTLTASPVLTTILTNDAYTALPTAYLLTENDQALPVAYQQNMVDMQQKRAGVHMTVYKSTCGHSPHLACTEELVAQVMDFGGKVTGTRATDAAVTSNPA